MVALQSPRPLVSPRAERARRLEQLFGTAAAHEERGFAPVLDQVVETLWRRAVVTRLGADAPVILQSAFGKKLRAGFSTYAGLGLSAIMCSRTRPVTATVAQRAVLALGLREQTARRFGLGTMPSLFLALCGAEADRIACAAATILVLDEILDDVWQDAPSAVERAARMARLIAEGVGPDVPLVRGARALLAGFLRGGPGDAGLRQRLLQWVEAERALDDGSSDPGACRAVGIAVSMEVLAHAAAPRRIAADELAWMTAVAELGQVLDDVLDVEKDSAAGRFTAAVLGEWDELTVAERLRHARQLTRALVEAGGARGVVLELYLSTFDDEMRRMARILIENP